MAPGPVENSLNASFAGAQPAQALLDKVNQALGQHGFTPDNTIAVTATCRDEICRPLVKQIEATYGASFDITGLGGLLTCGVVGMSAGLSHAPNTSSDGRARYVFFAFPHVGIEEDGTVGKVRRPGMSGPSGACGALIASLGELQKGGLQPLLLPADKHSPDDPEYSILKSRLAKRCQDEGADDAAIKGWQLADLTKVAARTFTADLEYLISKAVDTSKADYAVVTGVQIHCTTSSKISADLHELADFIAPTATYAVVNGSKRDLFSSNGAGSR